MTSRSFRMWVNDFSKNNKEVPVHVGLKLGDKVNTPLGSGMYVESSGTDECVIQMYESNKTVRLKIAVVRKV